MTSAVKPPPLRLYSSDHESHKTIISYVPTFSNFFDIFLPQPIVRCQSSLFCHDETQDFDRVGSLSIKCLCFIISTAFVLGCCMSSLPLHSLESIGSRTCLETDRTISKSSKKARRVPHDFERQYVSSAGKSCDACRRYTNCL